MEKSIKQLITEMTLEEKASLCSGLDFWKTKPIGRLNIPSIMMTDGPHGLRKQMGETDQLGIHNSVQATCFPSGATLASSWDREVIASVAEAIADEAKAEQVSIVLGPSVNIKRSPLCGRNFEYLSEDPYLASQLAKSYVMALQKRGVGTSIKHFAVNNQEYRRFSVDAIVDERPLRELYLSAFETAVSEAQPWTVMCAYNRVNGTYCSEHSKLLTDILRTEWGFEGTVVTDWGAANDRVAGLKAGQDLQMPGTKGAHDKKIVEAVQNGTLDEAVLDKTVERLLRTIFKSVEEIDREAGFDKEKHHQLAREMASESMVLLKNEGNILPLSPDRRVAVIGELAVNPRYQGGGSSHINPTLITSALDEMKKIADPVFAKGYSLSGDESDHALEEEAEKLALENEVVVLFAGLPDSYESEGYDRQHMRLPPNQDRLICLLSEKNKNIVVVLSNGSPVEMPWIGSVKGVLEGYLGGQAGGGAVTDLLYGLKNPSGKLAESFPVRLEDNPSYLNFPGEGDTVNYGEGLFIGYRYYDAKKVEPLFPFGFGLSYTTFDYTGITTDKREMSDSDELTVTVTVKNRGNRAGKEVIQLYVSDIERSVVRPEKELKGFIKVELQPGEEQSVVFRLGKRAFAYYDETGNEWYVEPGRFIVYAGPSSAELPLSAEIFVRSNARRLRRYNVNTTLEDIGQHPDGKSVLDSLAERFLGGQFGDAPEEEKMMMREMMKSMNLRMMANISGGQFTEEEAESIIRQLNS